MVPFLITEDARVNAPIERVFALSTRVELVQKTLGMNLIDSGVTSGHVSAGSRVHWRGWKFGLPTEHHTLLTGFVPPHTHFIRVDHQEITKEAYSRTLRSAAASPSSSMTTTSTSRLTPPPAHPSPNSTTKSVSGCPSA
jgi:hypothetical protein